MTKRVHDIYIFMLIAISVAVTVYIIYIGSSYYSTSLEERFYHHDHKILKPNGFYGHGFGIIGTLMILIGVFGYMARKRMKSLSRIWILKHWLELHIFLCTLGSIIILFHTAFKLGGIVSVSFWSMIAVVLSGVIGRFIYLQIPRTIQGRELSLSEIREMKDDITSNIKNISADGSESDFLSSINLSVDSSKGLISQYLADIRQIRQLNIKLKKLNMSGSDKKSIIKNISREISLNRKIQRLALMQRLFRYWHIAHLPFALIMLIIMVIHVAVALTLGYKWIF
jgi:hypothetical protein